VDQGVDLRSRLDPRRAPANNHEGELGLRDLTSHQRDFFEAFDHAVADTLGVFDTPHSESVLLDAGDAEEVCLAADRDHELVVRELHLAVGLYDLALVVYFFQLCSPKARPGRDKGAPQGLGDVAGLCLAADDRRHHRPEGEEVIARYYKDADILAVLYELGELLGGRETAEAATHDEDLFFELLVGRLLPGGVPGLGVERPPQRSQS
jgi:hypothetical protein